MTIEESRYCSDIQTIARYIRAKDKRQKVWVGEKKDGKKAIINLANVDCVYDIDDGLLEIWCASGCTTIKAAFDEFLGLMK